MIAANYWMVGTTMNELEQILSSRSLTPLFQPIVSCSQQAIFGYEALIRGPSDSPLHAPLNLFDAASRSGHLVDVELLAREVAIEQFGKLDLPGHLFLNVTPGTILEPRFKDGQTLRYLNHAGIDPQRVVIELTEQYPVDDYELLREAVSHYREMGFAIALDDLGAGYSSLRHWSELKPNYVKIDRHFVQNVNEDRSKRQFVRSILELAEGLGSRVILEGIETSDEYLTLQNMGLAFGQGYYFARPAAQPLHQLPDSLLKGSHNETTLTRSLGDTVASLANRVPSASPEMSLTDVIDIFHHAPELRSIAVVKSGKPIGLVHRQELMTIFTSPYGLSLNGKKPITHFMRKDILTVEETLAVEQLSQRITSDRELNGDEDFIITDDTGDYLGIGTILALLRKITELQIRNARYANPLSQLPGNVPINEHIESLLTQRTPFAVAYCDLDHFKAFNDHYGYARGDDVIVSVARVLSEYADPNHDFVGHVGGDDFIIIFSNSDWQARCDAILRKMELSAPLFYDSSEREERGIYGNDRSGNHTFHPFLSLSIGVVPVAAGEFESHHEVATSAAEVKKQAKKIEGNSIYVDHRQNVQCTIDIVEAPLVRSELLTPGHA